MKNWTMKNLALRLFAFTAFLLIGAGAMAQGGASPYVNSTHTYTATPQSGGNTLSWTVTGGTATDYTITNGTTAAATILWKTAGTYTVTFRETSSNSCFTERTIGVTVTANLFDLAVTAPSDFCATIAPNAAAPNPTTVVFNVAVAGNTAKASTFDYTLTGDDHIASVAFSDGITATSIMGAAGVTIPSGVASFTVTVVVNSVIADEDTIAFGISNAKDFYNTPENNTANNSGEAVIWAVPNTSPITAD